MLRLLLRHPNTEIRWLTSESFTGEKISTVFPTFINISDLVCKSVREIDRLQKADLVFSCLPHGASGHYAKLFLESGAKVIDFSSDLRSINSKTNDKAVYGLPELYRKKIKNSKLVANPGCYATAALLGLAPLIRHDLIQKRSINIDAKAGLSGGGRAPVGERQFSEANDTISVNSISGHNQQPEIEDKLYDLYKTKISLIFSAFNINIDRGILTTISAKLKTSVKEDRLISKYRSFYRNEKFIRITHDEKHISTKNVRFTNYCDIGLTLQNGHVICVTALDNLGKGASGQAVQNMNLIFGLDESAGLLNTGLYP